MGKVKTVERDGKITITKTEERYPYAADILMGNGFGIICLNMALGLLPVTIWGTRMKYFKCSISQLYTFVFGLCFVILSVIFVPVEFFPDSEKPTTMTNLVIIVALGLAHVLGYILLIIRGHYVAYKIPIVWVQLCKLLQISLIDVYGKNCYLLKEAASFGRWAVFEFFCATFTSMGTIVIWSTDYNNVYSESSKHYKLYYVANPMHTTPFQKFQVGTFKFGYGIWQICSFGHVLVSMLLCYFVIVIVICLKSVNQQIQELLGKVDERNRNAKQSNVLFQRAFDVAPLSAEVSSSNCLWTSYRKEKAIRSLDKIKHVMIITEKLIETISSVWGISLVVEALILIASGTVNSFNFLSQFQKNNGASQQQQNNSVSVRLPEDDYWVDLFVTASIHFYFLFKLSCRVNTMNQESKTSLQLLKQVSYHDFPQDIQTKIQMLKQDVSTTSMSLTAANYFQINKFLITSITSQVATYLIVLLQFAQQEINLSNPSTGNKTSQ